MAAISKVVPTGVGGGGGGGLAGAPNAIVYITPGGVGYVTDADLTVAPIDVFGRPQIWDNRDNAGTGSVFRQGQWQADGDPGNQMGQGIVVYGENALGVLDPSNGGYARVKSNRFGLGLITPGVWTGAPPGAGLYYAWRVDHTEMSMRPDTPGAGQPAPSFTVNRATGDMVTVGNVSAKGTVQSSLVKSSGNVEAAAGTVIGSVLRTGGALGPRILSGVGPPLGAVPGSIGDLYLDTAGGPLTTLWVNETGGVGGWAAK